MTPPVATITSLPLRTLISNADRVSSAKFWLGPVERARHLGFRAVELQRIRRILVDRERALLEAWRDFFRT